MRITVNDIKTNLGITNTYDIVNAIRNSASDSFQKYVPLANAENVADIGMGLLLSQTVQNEFITSLVDRISLVVINKVSLNNPLKKFKRGTMPLGRTIEEIFTDITSAHQYDPSDAESTLFKRQIPNVRTLFHERNRQDVYVQTIQDDSLKSAFTSWGAFDSFLSSIINAIYNSAEVDEYEYMKLIIDNYYSKGLFKVIEIDEPVTATAATDMIKKMRATATRMALPTGSRDYNSLAVRTRTDMNDIHVFISAEVDAEVDVDVLAKAFNMSKTDFLGNVTVIDGFASDGLQAVMVDKDFFMVYDTLLKMETVRNPKGLYWNYFYHVWQVLSASRFANAVAFVSGDVPPVTQVIVDPTIVTMKPATTFQFKAYVRATDGADHPVVWTLAGRNGTTIASGTTVSSTTGLVALGATQTGELSVIATVEDGGGTGIDVVGESYITVV